MYLSGMWLVEAPRMDIIKNVCSKQIGLCAEIMIITMDSKIYMTIYEHNESSLDNE